MRYVVTLGQRELVVELGEGREGKPRLVVDSVPVGLEVLSTDPLVLRTDDGRIVEVIAEPEGGAPGARGAAHGRPVRFSALGVRGEALVDTPDAHARPKPIQVASGVLASPMPGRIARVLTEVGAQVAAGTPLVVVEAMKIENELLSPQSGTVSEVRVRAGDAVESGAVLVVVV